MSAVTNSTKKKGPMTQTQQTESAERIARPLIQLAKLNGISTSYIDQLGTYVEIRDEVLVSVLAALGVDASSDEAITASYAATQQRIADTLAEPTVVKFIGKEAVTPIRAKGNDVALKLTLEDGTEYAGDLTAYLTGSNADDGSLQLTLPDDIPAGYHTLAVDAGPLHAEAALICAPARIELPPAVAEKQRWGWMAQMYSIRSAESWGIGDYGDLKRLLADAAEKSKADFMLINPIHASAPIPPLEPSPYLPESRRFLNVTYIRPQDIPEYANCRPTWRAGGCAARRRPRATTNRPRWTSTRLGGQAPGAAPDLQAGREQQARAAFDAFQDHRRPGPRFLRHMVACASRYGARRGARTVGSSRRPSTTRPCASSSRSTTTCSSSTAGCSGSPPSR